MFAENPALTTLFCPLTSDEYKTYLTPSLSVLGLPVRLISAVINQRLLQMSDDMQQEDGSAHGS